MRPFLRWLVHGKRQPPILLPGLLLSESNPREEALIAMAAALEAQTLMLERFASAAEQVAATLERAEQRALPASEQPELERA